jgi:hypothetical protein
MVTDAGSYPGRQCHSRCEQTRVRPPNPPFVCSLLRLVPVQCTHPASAVGAGCTQCAACEPLPVPAGWSGSPSIGLRPAAGAKLQGINGSSSNSANSSRNSSSSPGPGPGQASQLGAGREAAQGLPGLTSPTPGGVDSFLNRWAEVLCLEHKYCLLFQQIPALHVLGWRVIALGRACGPCANKVACCCICTSVGSTTPGT